MQRIAFGAACLLFAVGCGGGTSASSVCDDFGNSLNGLRTKYSACGTLPDFGFNKDSCVQAYNNAQCSDADKQKIRDFVNCLNNMPTCTTQTANAWGTQLESCLTAVDTINC